jgi:hypothetical protein
MEGVQIKHSSHRSIESPHRRLVALASRTAAAHCWLHPRCVSLVMTIRALRRRWEMQQLVRLVNQTRWYHCACKSCKLSWCRVAYANYWCLKDLSSCLMRWDGHLCALMWLMTNSPVSLVRRWYWHRIKQIKSPYIIYIHIPNTLIFWRHTTTELQKTQQSHLHIPNTLIFWRHTTTELQKTQQLHLLTRVHWLTRGQAETKMF